MGVISNGTTLLDAGALSVASGSMTLIKTLTASSSSTLSFVHGASGVVFDGTYKEYVFKFIDISNGSNATFKFNVSIDSGSNYNVAKTTSRFRAEINEGDGSDNALAYLTAEDLANATGAQVIASVRSDGDSCCAGTLQIFDPASTTKVKHFLSRLHSSNGDYCEDHLNAGYANTTSAVNAIQFSMSAGNIAAGTIKMYGIV